MTTPGLRWFAIVWLKQGRVTGGYALDYRPEEKADYEKQHGPNIIGDFATSAEAMDAVRERLKVAARPKPKRPRLDHRS